jgi:hypothetical protein
MGMVESYRGTIGGANQCSQSLTFRIPWGRYARIQDSIRTGVFDCRRGDFVLVLRPGNSLIASADDG